MVWKNACLGVCVVELFEAAVFKGFDHVPRIANPVSA
jgi:hypothetical protein